MTLWIVAQQAPLPMGFSKQEYWSELHFFLQRIFPAQGSKPTSPVSPALVGRFFTTEPSGSPLGKKDTAYRCFTVAKLRLTLCDLMIGSKPGFPVLYYLLEFAQTYVHSVSDAIQPSICCPFLLLPSLFPSNKVFFLQAHQTQI